MTLIVGRSLGYDPIMRYCLNSGSGGVDSLSLTQSWHAVPIMRYGLNSGSGGVDSPSSNSFMVCGYNPLIAFMLSPGTVNHFISKQLGTMQEITCNVYMKHVTRNT